MPPSCDSVLGDGAPDADVVAIRIGHGEFPQSSPMIFQRPARGARLGYIASALLLTGHIAEVAVITLVAVQFNVLASAPDRQAAVIGADLIQDSGMWYRLGAITLVGEILGLVS
jgi:hypothetical protein